MTRVTIKQVAQVAGVSPMTVSRVLNDRPDVSSETRRRILEVIEQLNYAPNAVARSLSQGRSNTFGVVGTGLEYFGPSHTIASIERLADQLGYSLMLKLIHDPENDSGTDTLNELVAQQVDGVLWAVPQIGDNREALCKQIQEISTPVVFLDMAPHPSAIISTTDNYHGGRLATEHLLNQGYTKIGIISGPLSWWSASERLAGWRDVLYDAGITDTDFLIANGNWSPQSGEEGMQVLLDREPALEAVFACNDQMALGALATLRKTGHHVPDDVAIVGYDDIPEAAYFFPPLTTINQGISEMSEQGVHLLHHSLAAKRKHHVFEATVEWVQPKLIIRESSIVANP